MQPMMAWKALTVLVLVAAVPLAGAEEKGGKADLKQAVGAAKTTLARAIEIAQKEVAGAKVLEAGLEVEKDATFYEVVVLSGEVVKEVKVDAASGKVLGVKEEQPDVDELKELAELKQALGAVKLTFAQALEAAAKEVKDGKPFAVELEVEDGKPAYEVKLLQGDKVLKVELDAASGKVAEVEEHKPGQQKEGEKREGEHKDGEKGHGEHKDGEHRDGEHKDGEHKGGEIAEAKAALAAAKVSLTQALETAGKEVKDGKAVGVELEMEDGKPTCSVMLLQGDKVMEVKIDAVSGKMGKVEEEKVDADEVKELAETKQALGVAKISLALALEAAVKEVKDGKPMQVELGLEDNKPMYEVKLLQGDKLLEALIDPVNGKVVKVETEEPAKGHKEADEEDDEEGEHDGKHEGRHEEKPGKDAADSAWRQEFKVDKTNWSDRGANPYFLLEPGYRAVYKHGAVVLTITILNETKVVDGVTTRVLEEREEKDGKPLEISRNYLALDKSTGDLYYFGEDVDEYKDGKVASHEGAWLSGVNGATFGLLLPGKPQLGDKYYQEIAPKVAMDRAEIAGLDEKIATPAGNYEKCLHIEETSPLEKGASHKVYAPGIGLVRDDEFLLEKVELPKR